MTERDQSQTPAREGWRPASSEPAHPLARLDGASVGEDVTLETELGPRNHVGSTYFRVYLRSDELGRTVEPVVFGLQNSGPYPGWNWVEVLRWNDQLHVEDGRGVSVPPGIEALIFERLAELVPPGGHLMAEYESGARWVTAAALAARVPPAATPLGRLLARTGAGVAFRDWYIPEGGREGPRKLQGFRALDEQHARTRGLETIAALEAFLADTADLDWDVQAQTRPLAEEALAELRERYQP